MEGKMKAQEEPRTFKITMAAYPDDAERLKSRLRKFYRKRAEKVSEPEKNLLKVRMRNGSEVECRLAFSESPASRFSRVPFAEIIMTAPKGYIDYSVSAAQKNAARNNIYLTIETEEPAPK
jgi:hypothetical protein